jgi:proteasome assembly chaperone 4
MQDNRVSVTSVLGGTSDNTGSSMARRLGIGSISSMQHFMLYLTNGIKLASLHVSVLKTGLNIVLACNIPKDSPMLEVITSLSLHSCC